MKIKSWLWDFTIDEDRIIEVEYFKKILVPSWNA